jgi:myo-inositol-1(or 4)-monophosphatase
MHLPTLQAHIVELAKEAGATLRSLYNQPHQLQTKSSIFDIVTEGDKAAEAIIVPALRSAYPDFRIISEEGAGVDARLNDAEYIWHIDPIDGTVNFASAIPHFCVSIGLSDRNLRPLLGVVYDPILGEMFTAARGHGAALNDTPIRVSQNTDMHNAVMATGFPATPSTSQGDNLRELSTAMRQCRAVRNLGSCALELCYVASGRLDGFWESYVKTWDYMAGMMIVEEAGGMVTDRAGGANAIPQGEIVATNGALHPPLLNILRG